MDQEYTPPPVYTTSSHDSTSSSSGIDQSSSYSHHTMDASSMEPITLQTPRSQQPIDTNAVSSDDYQMMQTPTAALQDRNRLFLDIIMIVICILLILFAFDCLFVGSVRIGIFNKSVKGVTNPPKQVRRYIANMRFAAASGIIGGICAFTSAILGLASVPFRKATSTFKKVRIVLGILFVLNMLWIMFVHFLTICVSMAIFYKFDTADGNARGSAWLFLGLFQFLILFHGGIIAFAILRIVFDARHRLQ